MPRKRVGRLGSALLDHPDLCVILLAILVLLPFLGSTGLWDPWETHYAEVARRMISDGDWLHLRWRHEDFFSKPVGIFWMIGLSFKLFGINALAARLPFAVLGILGVWMTYRFVAKLSEPKRGLWSALVLVTSPFYYFIARQAITDIPFAVFVLGCLANFILVARQAQPQRINLILMYVFAGLAALAKTPIGLAIPGAVVLVYLIMLGDFRILKRLGLIWGIPLFLVVCAPWYVYISIVSGGKFVNEFIMHHNVQRAFTGVHGDRGTFVYYVEQLGYGLFPWIALVPVAFSRLAALFGCPDWKPTSLVESSAEPGSNQGDRLHLDLFLLCWFLVSFASFTLIVTKFHHYVLPAVMPLAILVGLSLADEKQTGWRVFLPLSALLLAMVTNDVVSSSSHLSNLCTYAYERPFPEDLYPRWYLFAGAFGFGALMVLARWVHNAKLIRLGLGSIGLVMAVGISWFWVAELGSTMGQQDLFETYQRLAKPGEKLYQYQMNWRGEVFYSQDTIVKLSNPEAVKKIFSKPGRHFIIAVKDSFSALDQAVREATGKHLHILPGSSIRNVIASNIIESDLEDQNPLSRHVMQDISEIGQIQHPLRARFQDQIDFLGYELSAPQVGPGDEFALTLYFRCLKTMKKSWKVFVHIDGQGHEFHRINGDHVPIEGLFPTDHWMPGDVVRDRIKLSMPIEFTAKQYSIYLGFYIGNKRMKLDPPAPTDGKNRLLAGTFESP